MLGVPHRVLGVLHRVLGILHRVLGVPHRVIGVLHRVLGVLHRVLGVNMFKQVVATTSTAVPPYNRLSLSLSILGPLSMEWAGGQGERRSAPRAAPRNTETLGLAHGYPPP